MTLLDTIREPAQLRALSDDQLELLAAELREKMIRTVHKTGGHLASSLGAVEITRFFQQKKLTGRLERTDAPKAGSDAA